MHQDLALPTACNQALLTGRRNLVTARKTLQPIIQTNLNVETRSSMDKSWSKITTDLIKIANQLLDNVKSLVNKVLLDIILNLTCVEVTFTFNH